MLGASRLAVFWRVVLPQLRPGLIAAWLTTFIVCMRELVASILLLPPGTDTTATFIFNQFEQGDISAAWPWPLSLSFQFDCLNRFSTAPGSPHKLTGSEPPMILGGPASTAKVRAISVRLDHRLIR
ncbi:MAG: hypothetical protein LR015_13885 [Verrucomicrobia bacterium]|nr:hypothetical protein [Verrucomicrobiota bacterium]